MEAKLAHPLTDKVPAISASDRNLLREGIASKGQIHPIIIKDNLIWDGRNRQEICQELGIEPRYEEYTGPLSAAEYILQANLRRNITSEQRDAMIMALAKDVIPQMREEAAKARINGNANRKSPELKSFREPGTTSPKKPVHTHKRFRELVGHCDKADQAIVVLKHSDLSKKVEDGEISLRDASKEAAKRKKERKAPKRPTISELAERRQQAMIQSMDKKGRRDVGLTREEVDPDFQGSSMEFLDKYGHVPIMTKVQLETDQKNAVLMDWVSALNDLQKPLERYLAYADFDLTEAEAWIAKSPDTRLKRITNISLMLSKARDSLERLLAH